MATCPVATVCVDISPHRALPYREAFLLEAYNTISVQLPSCTFQPQTVAFQIDRTPREKESTRSPQVPPGAPELGY